MALRTPQPQLMFLNCLSRLKGNTKVQLLGLQVWG
jgi:hypothetical protein